MKKILQKVLFLAGLSSMIFSINAQAEIYKWTDDKGQVHYSARPPVQKTKRVKATNIEDKIRSAAGKYRPPAKEATATTTTTDAKVDTSNTNKEELQGPDKALVDYCKNQENNLAQLKKNYRNVWVDVSGKKTNLTQEQRLEKVAHLKAKIKQDCAGVKTQ